MAVTTSRILVVEDEPAISDVVATALRYQGHSVTQADDGLDGLSRASRSSFDLIVLDVMLPGLDGFEICRRLRDRGQLAPVLFLTARAETEDRVDVTETAGGGVTFTLRFPTEAASVSDQGG